MQGRQRVAFEVELDEPVKPASDLQDTVKGAQVQCPTVLRIEGKSHAPCPDGMHPFGLFRRDALIESDNSKVPTLGTIYRIQIHAVVETVRIGVYDQTTVHPQCTMRGAQVFEGRIGGRVLAGRGVRESALRPKNVEMSIPGTGRKLPARW